MTLGQQAQSAERDCAGASGCKPSRAQACLPCDGALGGLSLWSWLRGTRVLESGDQGDKVEPGLSGSPRPGPNPNPNPNSNPRTGAGQSLGLELCGEQRLARPGWVEWGGGVHTPVSVFLLSPQLTPPVALGSDLLQAGAKEIRRPPAQGLCHCSQVEVVKKYIEYHLEKYGFQAPKHDGKLYFSDVSDSLELPGESRTHSFLGVTGYWCSKEPLTKMPHLLFPSSFETLVRAGSMYLEVIGISLSPVGRKDMECEEEDEKPFSWVRKRSG
ncbi:PREDICTED: uncharacterized protein LOC102256033 [Myotis brandtii]|uniref:uncharacterized protein LOC102256033 n=1 Tax=Myotis brandtii TaxID=109478 RepID=UPI0007047505|nr:PREDICTED: uncharacterized protein LOC102256033 [Myotis brandtii]